MRALRQVALVVLWLGAAGADVELTELVEEGRYAEAVPVVEAAVREQEASGDTLLLAQALHDRAEVYRYMGRYEEAEESSRHALEIREATLGKDHLDVAATLLVHGTILIARGRYEEAKPIFERSRRLREQALGAEHTDVTDCLKELAYLHYIKGDY